MLYLHFLVQILNYPPILLCLSRAKHGTNARSLARPPAARQTAEPAAATLFAVWPEHGRTGSRRAGAICSEAWPQPQSKEIAASSAKMTLTYFRSSLFTEGNLKSE